MNRHAGRTARPGRWSTVEIRRFMFAFGALSSVFDLTTCGVLLALTRGSETAFRTGWFVESLLTELLVLLVLRTRRPFWRSRPGRAVLWSTLVVSIFTLALPFVGLGSIVELTPLPLPVLGAVVGIALAYVAATEALKHGFFPAR